MNDTTRKGLEAALGVAFLTVALVWLSGGFEEKIEPTEVAMTQELVPASEIRTVTAEEVQVVEWASGEVASARHTSVASRVLARIEEIRVRAGTRVEEGDVLITLDARDLRAQLGKAKEALRAAEARLELAEREYERTQELFRTGVAPQRQLDEVLSQLRAARAEVAGRKQALEEARTAASFAEIRSPVTGRVIDRLAEPGDTAVPGRPLLRIYDPTLLRVEAPVRESLAVRLGIGNVLQVDIPALDRTVEGRIDEIVPFAERGARTLLVKVSLPRSDARLFAGMYARVAIPAGKRLRMFAPDGAIARVGQLEFVTVVDPEDHPERRLVRTGETRVADEGEPARVEVLSGLVAGERIRLPDPPGGARDEPTRGGGSASAAEDSVMETDSSPPPAEAVAAVSELRKRLGKALGTALSKGPAEAIGTCHTEAPRITAETSSSTVSVGRTSHRLRNPENAPADWMKPLLDDYREREPEPGSFRTVRLSENETGYVEPIYIKPLCLTCHGENVAPEILALIRERYPEDQATGFRLGDFRGLFWAVVRDQG